MNKTKGKMELHPRRNQVNTNTFNNNAKSSDSYPADNRRNDSGLRHTNMPAQPSKEQSKTPPNKRKLYLEKEPHHYQKN